MKVNRGILVLVALVSLLIFTGCKVTVEPTPVPDPVQDPVQDPVPDPVPDIPEVYSNFYNYPDGRKDAGGRLTLKNLVSTPVLVFTDSVDGANYIGTIPALSNITVRLTPGKFYNIVAVQKTLYEENPVEATQTSKLAYYSDVQAYTVNVSAENLTGNGKWIFNNTTNYWVSIESVDDTQTFAVIAPRAQRVTVPTQSNRNYDYKIVYKQELKYNNVTVAVAEVSRQDQNDTAVFRQTNNFTVTTDLSLAVDNEYSSLNPSVQLINNSGKSLRVYNGEIQVSSFGALDAEDYLCISGETAFFTGFTANSNSTGLKVRSTAWNGAIACTESTVFQKGKVYVITVTNNPSNDPNASPVTWSVVEQNASDFYSVE